MLVVIYFSCLANISSLYAVTNVFYGKSLISLMIICQCDVSSVKHDTTNARTIVQKMSIMIAAAAAALFSRAIANASDMIVLNNCPFK